MGERANKEIVLADKKRAEFDVFWQILQPCSNTKVTNENILFLSCWADEYQVNNLRARCEEYGSQFLSSTISHLRHSFAHNYPLWTEACLRNIESKMEYSYDRGEGMLAV